MSVKDSENRKTMLRTPMASDKLKIRFLAIAQTEYKIRLMNKNTPERHCIESYPGS